MFQSEGRGLSSPLCPSGFICFALIDDFRNFFLESNINIHGVSLFKILWKNIWGVVYWWYRMLSIDLRPPIFCNSGEWGYILAPENIYFLIFMKYSWIVLLVFNNFVETEHLFYQNICIKKISLLKTWNANLITSSD